MNDMQGIWPEGMKRTRQRESILAVLKNAKQPLSAADICMLMEKGSEAIWMSTVYRVLDQFVKKGLVLKTNMLNSDMSLYEYNRFKHQHYAVCMNCRKIFPMENCPMEQFHPKLADEGFRVTGHSIEVFGFCSGCKPG